MNRLKELRIEKGLTQQQVASLAGVSLRSYKSYENDESKFGTIKYDYLVGKLLEVNPIDEEHGMLSVDVITKKCSEIFDKYDIQFCYLFGSYAKKSAKPTSDVDLLIASEVSGLKFYGLVEELRMSLSKKVDVLDFNQLKDNLELTYEILKDGIKIYG